MHHKDDVCSGVFRCPEKIGICVWGFPVRWFLFCHRPCDEFLGAGFPSVCCDPGCSFLCTLVIKWFDQLNKVVSLLKLWTMSHSLHLPVCLSITSYTVSLEFLGWNFQGVVVIYFFNFTKLNVGINSLPPSHHHMCSRHGFHVVRWNLNVHKDK